ncbi:MAG: restriction endonuclease subunit S [bacterium]
MLVKRVKYSMLKGNWMPSRYVMEPEKPDYPVRRLNSIAEINPKSRLITVRKDDNREISVVEIGSIDNIGKIVRPTTYQANKVSTKVRLQAFDKDILFPLIQTKNYTPALVQEDNVFISDNFAVISTKINPYYLFWALTTEYVYQQIEARSRGSIINRIPTSDLEEILIPWLDENERIKKANIIKKKLQQLTSKEHSIFYKKNIDTLFQDLFQYKKEDLSNQVIKKISYDKLRINKTWQTDLFLNKDIIQLIDTNNIKVVTLETLAKSIDGGLNLYKGKGDREVKVIKAKNLDFLSINKPFDIKNIDKNKFKELNTGDLIMRRKGGVGPAAVIDNKLDNCIIDDNLVRIKVKKDIIPEYLAIYLNSNLADYLLSVYTISKTMSYIRISDLKKIKILIPSLKIQQEIILKVKNLNKKESEL